MIFTKIFIDNLYCFADTEIDFTFARKIKKSTIEGEYLQDAPNFKYKKACILSGANASGKTAFGRVLCGIQNFLYRQELIGFLRNGICDKSKPATFAVEFAALNIEQAAWELHHLRVGFINKGKSVDLQHIAYASTPIQSSETNVSARNRLQKIISQSDKRRKVDNFLSVDFVDASDVAIPNFNNLRKLLDNLNIAGWYYTYAGKDEDTISQQEDFSLTDKQLEKFLSAFDHSIERVAIMTTDDEVVEGIKIFWKNGDTANVLFGDDGDVTNPDRLSRGTYEAVVMAMTYAQIKKNIGSNLYYIDEKMAYCHSEMEQAVINLLVQSLPADSQLFYTTHNYDILDLNFPPHSYYIFKKEDGYSEVVNIEEVFNKNDRGLLNYLKNDAFRTLPDTSGIDDLLFEV